MYIRFLQFRSSLLSESLLLSFPLPTKIFQFDRYCLHLWIHALLTCGFSHSDSSGSLLTYSSPKRFAVRRVLLRLLVPRHPLCALCSLTFFCNSNSTKFLSTFQRSLFFKIGGAKRDRTADLLRAKQALSQLSYSPNKYGGPKWT